MGKITCIDEVSVLESRGEFALSTSTVLTGRATIWFLAP